MPSKSQTRRRSKRRSSLFPDRPTLTAGLRAALAQPGSRDGGVTVLHRRRNLYAETFPSEVVTCRLGHGRRIRLFCKYEAGRSHSAHGHRGGVAYEAEVYRQVLGPSRFSAPRLYGTYADAARGDVWLILQHLDHSARINEAEDPGAIVLAARWLARFHAAQETRLARASLSFLRAYDADYYRGWARRTVRFAGHWHRRFPWLDAVCRRLDKFVALLLAASPTVIHGEYYPSNVLFRRGKVYPVDWESAAVAAGEIDLATLTDAWSAEVVEQCQQEYQRTRWPDGPPANFRETLDAARLYLRFHWDRPDWTEEESSGPYFKELALAAQRLGLI